MSRRIWTTQGKVIVAVFVVITIAFLLFGGCKAISKIVKEVKIGELEVPNNEK